MTDDTKPDLQQMSLEDLVCRANSWTAVVGRDALAELRRRIEFGERATIERLNKQIGDAWDRAWRAENEKRKVQTKLQAQIARQEESYQRLAAQMEALMAEMEALHKRNQRLHAAIGDSFMAKPIDQDMRLQAVEADVAELKFQVARLENKP